MTNKNADAESNKPFSEEEIATIASLMRKSSSNFEEAVDYGLAATDSLNEDQIAEERAAFDRSIQDTVEEFEESILEDVSSVADKLSDSSIDESW